MTRLQSEAGGRAPRRPQPPRRTARSTAGCAHRVHRAASLQASEANARPGEADRPPSAQDYAAIREAWARARGGGCRTARTDRLAGRSGPRRGAGRSPPRRPGRCLPAPWDPLDAYTHPKPNLADRHVGATVKRGIHALDRRPIASQSSGRNARGGSQGGLKDGE